MTTQARAEQAMRHISFSIDAMAHFALTYGYLKRDTDIMRIEYKHKCLKDGSINDYFPEKYEHYCRYAGVREAISQHIKSKK